MRAATGVKILAKDVEKALAGMPMLVAARTDEQELLTEEMEKILASMISSIKLNDRGVYVQASTLGMAFFLNFTSNKKQYLRLFVHL